MTSGDLPRMRRISDSWICGTMVATNVGGVLAHLGKHAVVVDLDLQLAAERLGLLAAEG